MGWKCPKCNTVHPYSVRKCSCGDVSSSREKASPPTRTGEDQKRETLDLGRANEGPETTASRKQTEHLEAQTELKELRSDLDTLRLGETSKQPHERCKEIIENDAESNLSSEEAAKLKGIGGWLILVIIGLFVSLGYLLHTVYTDVQLFANGSVAFISNPASKVYIPAYGGFLKFELITTIILSVAAIYLVYLFFRKDSKFPKYYVLFLISAVVYVLLDYGLCSMMIVPVEAKNAIEDAMSQQGTAIGRTFISALVWGSYIRKSKRVKATFG